jgi:hypothetical protein
VQYPVSTPRHIVGVFYLAAVLTVLFVLPGEATTITAWDPSPSELPSAFYNQILLGNDPTLWTWSASFTSTLTNVLVAPPIDPIPYQLGIDYSGTFDNLNVSLSFTSAGEYAARLDFADGTQLIQFFNPGSAPGDKKKEESSRQQRITFPVSPDVRIIETPDSDNGFDADAAQIFPGGGRAASVDAAITQIEDAYRANNNQPVAVQLIGHGAPGDFSVGAGQGNRADAALQDNSAATQAFINRLKGKVSSVTLVGCSVGSGLDDSNVMQILANGLNVAVYGWDDCVVSSLPTTILGVTIRSGYISIDEHGSQIRALPIVPPTQVPEPSVLVFLATGLVTIVVERRFRSAQA